MDSSSLHACCNAIVEAVETHSKCLKGFGWFSHFGDHGKNNGTLKKWMKKCEESINASVEVLRKNIDYSFNQFSVYLNQKDTEIADLKKQSNCLNIWNQQNIKELNNKYNTIQEQTSRYKSLYAELKEKSANLQIKGQQTKLINAKNQDLKQKLIKQKKQLEQKIVKNQMLLDKAQRQNVFLMMSNKKLEEQVAGLQKKIKFSAEIEKNKYQLMSKYNQEKSKQINRLQHQLYQLQRYSQPSIKNFETLSIGAPTQLSQQPFSQIIHEEDRFDDIAKRLSQLLVFEGNFVTQRYSKMDVNGDGKISKQEYMDYLKEKGVPDNEKSRKQIDHIFEVIGINGLVDVADEHVLMRFF